MRFVEPGAPLRKAALPHPAQDELSRLYAELGGDPATIRLTPGGWDLRTEDGLVIELDEEFHFTRYRAMTLYSDFLRALPWAKAYLGYCYLHEAAASRGGGGRWTSPSTERLFGTSDPPGVFGERGSARGKQRALYDAMKDLAAAAGVVRLSRVSIYDRVGGVALGDILYGRVEADPESIRAHVEGRAHGQSAP